VDLNWFYDISSFFGSPFACFILFFVALIPGFLFIFVFSSLLMSKSKESENLSFYPDVTILIPTYNPCKTKEECEIPIIDTIKSILKQQYEGKIIIKIIDDGSKDDTIQYLKNSDIFPFIDELIESEHRGKFNALNLGLKKVSTEYVLTIDDDTILHEKAIINVVKNIHNSEFVAVAGCLLVKNNKESLISKIQEWDYSVGIYAVKYLQSSYESTLVVQGAFSIYRTNILKELGGWTDHLGEDIILTWKMLKHGYKTSFAEDAIAFTSVPTTYQKLGIQRKRWARGMIEAFKDVKKIFSSKANIETKHLIFTNIFFPFIDLAIFLFIPIGILLLLIGNYLLIGIMTLLIIPWTIMFILLIQMKFQDTLKKLDIKLGKRSKLALIIYILFYGFILAPYCLIGYISEITNLNKKWGTH
jgi:biofilm PGA synthesis N-glycosyltransferase PgaC